MPQHLTYTAHFSRDKGLEPHIIPHTAHGKIDETLIACLWEKISLLERKKY